MLGERECPLAARRLLNYEFAVTTAVKKATVMIRINIVTALKASVVISLLTASYGRRWSKWPAARFTGVEVVFCDRPLRLFFSILSPGLGLGRIPYSVY